MGGLKKYYFGKVKKVYDVDALAFIIAAGLTDNNQKSAIDTLVKSLKSNNLWDKMYAIYPFVGGTATSHKFNLKDSRDLDAAFRLVFSGPWIHNENGVTPNGGSTGADTKLIPSAVFNNTDRNHLSYYSKTASTSDSNNYAIGTNDTGSRINSFILRNSNKYALMSYSSVANYQATAAGVIATNGLFICNAISSGNNIFRNNTKLTTTNSGGSFGLATVSICIGGYAPVGTGGTTAICAFSSIGKSLSDSDSTTLYSIVQQYQTTLGRQN